MHAVRAVLGLIMVLVAAVAGLYLTSHLLAAPEQQGSASVMQDAAAVPVQTMPVQTTSFSETARAVGTARARRAIDLTAEASGRIARIAFQPGMQVAQGDLLLELDDRAVQADLKAAEATLTEAQAAFARQERLNQSGSASDAAYQTARAALLRAEAQRDLAQIAVEDRHLRAPFAGVVGLTDLVEGQMIDAGAPVATLDDLAVIEVSFSVPEILLPRLHIGQRVDMTSAAWPDRVFQGSISRIDSRVDATTRSVGIRAEIANDDRALAGGMFLLVTLVLGEGQALAVPERALSAEGNINLVLVAEDGTARRTEIRIGRQNGDLIEVLEGLEPDAQIIVSNLHRVQAGSAVQVMPQQARAAAMPTDAAAAGGGG